MIIIIIIIIIIERRGDSMTVFFPGGFSVIEKEKRVKNQRKCFNTTWEKECDANV